MSKQLADCSDEFLLKLLRAEDDSEELRKSSSHVDQCSRCQTRIEQLAADPDEWQFAQQSLRQLDETASAAEVSRNEQRRQPLGIRDDAWLDSVTKQLLSSPKHPEMLGRIGRYDVDRLIGSGGMGVVFKAFDTELNRPVAVKVLAPHLACNGAARKRFAREARAAAAVVHEHVVAIHNVETENDSPFLVMPYVAGESLQQRIDRDGPLELCEILRIAMQTAFGLAAAHAQGLVHRDVKPSNILLEQGVERALLTDFGLARASDDASLTHSGYHPGTPQYMSPEQARGENVDARSDLFCLGSVIYAMCTGRAPFRAETSYGILRRITDHEPRSICEVNSVIPDWLDAIVVKLLAKPVEDRFQSAEEAAELLEQCLAHVQQPTTVPLPTGLIRKSSTIANWLRTARAHPIAVSAFVALTGTVVLGSRLTTNDDRPTDKPAEQRLSAGSPNTNSPPKSSHSATDWEETSSDISAFQEALTPFESRSHQLWDDRPANKKE